MKCDGSHVAFGNAQKLIPAGNNDDTSCSLWWTTCRVEELINVGSYLKKMTQSQTTRNGSQKKQTETGPEKNGSRTKQTGQQ
jgi:hypothetical protein